MIILSLNKPLDILSMDLGWGPKGSAVGPRMSALDAGLRGQGIDADLANTCDVSQ